ncbi:MAG: alpha/beta fold hydrolase [Rubrivivax sp.]
MPGSAPPALLELRTADGTALQARVYRPSARTGRHVLISGGLGIPQRFYAPFAEWLAARGHGVMTFDLRGMGDSRRPEHRRSLRGLQADMLTWARQDFAAAVAWLHATAEGAPVAVVGHSLGMHHAAMTDEPTQQRIDRVVSVAAGSGYWRDWSAPSRTLAPLMLHLAVPLLTPLLGYFPGKTLRMVGDLPGPAVQQWTRWCRHPGFAWGAQPELILPSLHSARFRVDAFSFTDDDAMSETCTRKLMAALPHAQVSLRVVSPAEVGLKAIGHIGAFRATAAERLWPLMAASLDFGSRA